VDSEKTAIAKLRGYLLSKMARLQELVDLLHVTQVAWNEYWRHPTVVQEQILERQKRIVAGILEFGNGTGELCVEDANMTAHLMVASLQSIEYQLVYSALKVPLAVYVEHMLDVIINGIRKR